MTTIRHSAGSEAKGRLHGQNYNGWSASLRLTSCQRKTEIPPFPAGLRGRSRQRSLSTRIRAVLRADACFTGVRGDLDQQVTRDSLTVPFRRDMGLRADRVDLASAQARPDEGAADRPYGRDY